jgi:hypothetical protein
LVLEINNKNNIIFSSHPAINQQNGAENCQTNSSPAFKGGIDSLLNKSGSLMNKIENGGFLVLFLIQDFLGMTVPRTCAGFLRDKEVTGEYNIQEDGVYVTRDYYLKHPILASAFAAASKRGWMWAAQHQEEAIDIVMKYVEKENVPTNRTMQRLMLKEIIRLQYDQQTGKQEFKLKKEMVEQANQLMYEYGLLANEISYEELIP